MARRASLGQRASQRRKTPEVRAASPPPRGDCRASSASSPNRADVSSRTALTATELSPPPPPSATASVTDSHRSKAALAWFSSCRDVAGDARPRSVSPHNDRERERERRRRGDSCSREQALRGGSHRTAGGVIRQRPSATTVPHLPCPPPFCRCCFGHLQPGRNRPQPRLRAAPGPRGEWMTAARNGMVSQRPPQRPGAAFGQGRAVLQTRL